MEVQNTLQELVERKKTNLKLYDECYYLPIRADF